MDLLGALADKVESVLPGAKQQVAKLADKAKVYINNMTDLEVKVHEATNHDPWGPHGTAMQEITNAAFTSDGFQQIMGVLDERMRETGENWRLVYKSLLLIEYMCKHGPLRIADAIVTNRLHRLEVLKENFHYKDAAGRDHGINVRQRAAALIALLTDRDRLNEERERAAKTSGKYGGVSSTQARYAGFGGSSGGFRGDGAGGGSGAYSSGSSSGYGAGGGSGSFGAARSTAATTTAAPRVATASADEVADPVEATRRRIERLKAEGALPESPGSGGGAAASGGGAVEEPVSLIDTPKASRAPKKLSDVKVNPAISAALGKAGLAPPPGAQQRGAASGGGGGASGIDLLGDLMSSAPATAAPAAAAGASDWDAFTSAPPAVAAAGHSAAAADDGWAAFESAPAAPKPAANISSLLAIPSGPAAPPGGPLPADAFADLSSAAPAPAAFGAGAASADPFAASSAIGPALASGGGLSKTGGAHQQGAKPKLGPETARAKDPFADLGMF